MVTTALASRETLVNDGSSRAWRWRLGANAVGSIVPAILQVAIVPVYIDFLGVATFGLLALYTSLVSIARVVDFGIGHSVNRLLASRVATGTPTMDASTVATDDVSQSVWHLLRVYWAIGLGLALTITLASFFSDGWFRSSATADARVDIAVRLMAIAFFFAWPINFYASALQGLGRTVFVNAVMVANTVATVAGSAGLLYLGHGSLHRLLMWQAVVALCCVTAYHLTLIRGLHARFPSSRSATRSNTAIRLAAGTGGATLIVVALGQIDRILVTQVLAIREYGTYMLSATVASGLSIASAPIFASLFPHLTGLVATNSPRVASEYRRVFSVLLSVVVPVGIAAIFRAYDLILLWTGDAALAALSNRTASILLVGTLALSLNLAAIALQLAHGDARIASRLGLGTVALIVPAVILAGHLGGSRSVAWAWSSIVVAFSVSNIALTHRRLLESHIARSLTLDIAATIAASVGAALLLQRVVPVPQTRSGTLISLFTIGPTVLLAAILTLRLRTRR